MKAFNSANGVSGKTLLAAATAGVFAFTLPAMAQEMFHAKGTHGASYDSQPGFERTYDNAEVWINHTDGAITFNLYTDVQGAQANIPGPDGTLEVITRNLGPTFVNFQLLDAFFYGGKPYVIYNVHNTHNNLTRVRMLTTNSNGRLWANPADPADPGGLLPMIGEVGKSYSSAIPGLERVDPAAVVNIDPTDGAVTFSLTGDWEGSKANIPGPDGIPEVTTRVLGSTFVNFLLLDAYFEDLRPVIIYRIHNTHNKQTTTRMLTTNSNGRLWANPVTLP